MSPATIFGTIALLGMAAVWGELVLESFPLTSAAKLLQTATLTWAMKIWWDRSQGRARRYAGGLALGLAFSIAGDFFLMGILDRESRLVLGLGVVSFAFTQIFYTLALRAVGTRPSFLALSGFAGAFFLLAMGNHWTLAVPIDLTIGSAIYSIFLGVMACHATVGLRNENLPWDSRRVAAAGAWIFVATDALLPLILFGEGAGIALPHLGLWVYQAYIVSQCLFTLSAFGLQSPKV